MIFNSLAFIIFFFAVLLVYYALPHKLRIPLLLAASLFFYACAGVRMLFYLVICIIATYFLGLLIERNLNSKRVGRALLALGIVLEVVTLCVFKYTNFFIHLFNTVCSRSLPSFSIVPPLGISFITFETISYLVDISRGKLAAEHSFIKYALFVSFFPKLTQGPIEKAGDMIPQFDVEQKYNALSVRAGLITALFGLFLKMVLADRLGIAVDNVFADLSAHAGSEIVLAVLFFSIQLYADFAGYSLIAIGCAKCLGFELKRNFSQPYFSRSVSEFWRRWHISLNVWLRDYIYIPLGGSRCKALRKYFNTMVVFGVSGLWHGASTGYVLWGLVNGVYVVLESIGKDIRKLRCKTQKLLPEWLQRTKTAVLVGFSWLFFRAGSMGNLRIALKNIFKHFNYRQLSASYYRMMLEPDKYTLFGLKKGQYVILLLAFLAMFFTDKAVEKRNISAESIASGNRAKRWIIAYALIFAILVFGIYGYGYSASSFIYTNF